MSQTPIDATIFVGSPQLPLFHRPPRQPRYPLVSQKQLWELLEALRRGEKLTVSRAIERYGIYALSQRCGELRNKLFWPIKSPMIALPNGKRVAEYSL